jgi:hypothetical protein
LRGGELHDGLLEDLPDFRELITESIGEADDNVQSGINYKPIVLRRLLLLWSIIVT